ncbi:ATP-binding protein [Salipaludibacillus sp. HK11]|uniref:ATP-binding protein n=1 Tax=Salipaludibacillus sp. HK11 TaxID=3394320 RepID=UPI0039FC6DC8
MGKISAYFIIGFALFIIGITAYSMLFSEVEQTGNEINNTPSNQGEFFALDGEWEFYWQQLLTPTDLEVEVTEPSYIEVPGSWKNQTVNGDALTSSGYGTYRTYFQIPISDIETHKTLSLYYVGSAYRVWIDGEEYDGLGTVGTNNKEEIPQIQRNIIFFQPKESVVEIVLQVSNYSFREGGISSEILYGEPEVLISDILSGTFITLVIIGGFIFIGLYHLIIFAKRKNELVILFLALSALAIGIRSFVYTEFLATMLFPFIRWETIIQIEYLCNVAFFICLVLTIKHLFPEEVHDFMMWLSYILTIIVTIFIVSTSSQMFTSALPYLVVVMVLMMLYFTLYVGTIASLRKREGAHIHLIGVLIIVLAAVNDTLVNIMVIDFFHMLEISFIIFILLQALIVSNKHALLLKNNAVLTKELIDLNYTLEVKIAERTEKLQEKNKELIELQKTRTMLVANIAHDIGTPIAGMHLYLQMIKEDEMNIYAQGVIPKLLDKLSYIQELNNDLLDLSKLESNNLSFYKEKVMVKEYVTDLYHSLRDEINDPLISIVLETLETNVAGKEVFVNIDKLRIKQVMQNLVGNAMKFNARDDETMITLHCYIVSDEQSSEVVVEVSDNGIGIADSELDYVFHRFYKKQENIEGSGLGLAIVKGIVEQHGGHVGVDSKLGVGSKFYFRLPVF